MTYPPTPPTNPGFPAAQQPGSYPGPGAPGYPAAPAAPSPGAGKAPGYLLAAVVALGFAAYLAGFGPLLRISSDMGPFGGGQFVSANGTPLWTVAAVLAALLAAVGLLPRSKSYVPIVAVVSVLGLFVAVSQIFSLPTGFSVGWGLWLGILFLVLQAAAAVTAVLFETGALTPPAPRPAYPPYNPAAGGYYGAPGQPGQQPGYPTQYGGYIAGTPGSGQTVPGYSAPDTSPATPPHGFPSYSQNPAAQNPVYAATPSEPTVAIPQVSREVTWESTTTVINESTPGSTTGPASGSATGSGSGSGLGSNQT